MIGISNQVLSEKYYQDMTSMFLNESLGIKERINYLYKILKLLNDSYDKIFEFINLYRTNLSSEYLSLKEDVFLDSIGEIYNCRRKVTILYGSNTSPTSELDLENAVKKEITLTNGDYIKFIKLTIAKQNFTGTREDLAKLYGGEETDIRVLPLDVNFIYWVDSNPLTVEIYWNNGNTSEFSSDLKYMFLNGLLTIESMGIIYHKKIQNLEDLSNLYDLAIYD